MIDNDVMVLQNCTDFLKCLPGSCSETCVTSFHDGNEVMSIKVEAVTEEEDPLLISFPGMKAEHEVSCISFVEDTLTDCACSRDVLLTSLMCQEYTKSAWNANGIDKILVVEWLHPINLAK